jgi:hypothetical protein
MVKTACRSARSWGRKLKIDMTRNPIFLAISSEVHPQYVTSNVKWSKVVVTPISLVQRGKRPTHQTSDPARRASYCRDCFPGFPVTNPSINPFHRFLPHHNVGFFVFHLLVLGLHYTYFARRIVCGFHSKCLFSLTVELAHMLSWNFCARLQTK